MMQTSGESSVRRGAPSLLIKLIYAIIIVLLCIGSLERNEIWGSGVSLWEDVVKKSPNKSRGYVNLGAEYILDGRYDEAIQASQKGIKLDENEYSFYYNIGVAKYFQKDLEGAYPFAHKAAVMHKDTMTLTHLGFILKEMGYRVENGKVVK